MLILIIMIVYIFWSKSNRIQTHKKENKKLQKNWLKNSTWKEKFLFPFDLPLQTNHPALNFYVKKKKISFENSMKKVVYEKLCMSTNICFIQEETTNKAYLEFNWEENFKRKKSQNNK